MKRLQTTASATLLALKKVASDLDLIVIVLCSYQVLEALSGNYVLHKGSLWWPDMNEDLGKFRGHQYITILLLLFVEGYHV